MDAAGETEGAEKEEVGGDKDEEIEDAEGTVWFFGRIDLHQLQMNHSVWIPCRVLLIEPSHLISYQLRPREVVSEPSLAGSASGEWPKLGSPPAFGLPARGFKISSLFFIF